jgi:hypothetical protein
MNSTATAMNHPVAFLIAPAPCNPCVAPVVAISHLFSKLFQFRRASSLEPGALSLLAGGFALILSLRHSCLHSFFPVASGQWQEEKVTDDWWLVTGEKRPVASDQCFGKGSGW